MKAQRESRGIALPFFNLGARWGGWSTSRTGRLTPGIDPIPIVEEAGWAPGSVWTGAENFASTGILSPERPASSQLLYQLRYPARVVGRIVLLTQTLKSLISSITTLYCGKSFVSLKCIRF